MTTSMLAGVRTHVSSNPSVRKSVAVLPSGVVNLASRPQYAAPAFSQLPPKFLSIVPTEGAKPGTWSL